MEKERNRKKGRDEEPVIITNGSPLRIETQSQNPWVFVNDHELKVPRGDLAVDQITVHHNGVAGSPVHCGADKKFRAVISFGTAVTKLEVSTAGNGADKGKDLHLKLPDPGPSFDDLFYMTVSGKGKVLKTWRADGDVKDLKIEIEGQDQGSVPQAGVTRIEIDYKLAGAAGAPPTPRG